MVCFMVFKVMNGVFAHPIWGVLGSWKLEVGMYIIEVDWAIEMRNRPSLHRALHLRRPFLIGSLSFMFLPKTGA